MKISEVPVDLGRTRLRDEWTVLVDRAQIIKAASARADYHEARQKHWQASFEEWNAEMEKTQSIESVPITGGKQQLIRYDPGLQQKVELARSKIAQHRAAATTYRLWSDMLKSETSDMKQRDHLTFDDYSFFFRPDED